MYFKEGPFLPLKNIIIIAGINVNKTNPINHDVLTKGINLIYFTIESAKVPAIKNSNLIIELLLKLWLELWLELWLKLLLRLLFVVTGFFIFCL